MRLVRHGEVDNPEHVVYASLPGFTLSERGRHQVTLAARRLAGCPVVAVWSSPLRRALDTAAMVARPHALPVGVDPGLSEWRLADRWSGVRWEDLPRRFPGELDAYLSDPSNLPFSPESLESLAERVARTLRDLDRRHPEGEVVVVTHQDPLQAGRLRLTGGDLGSLGNAKPGHAAIVTLRPGTPWEEIDAWEPSGQEPFPPAPPPAAGEDVSSR